MRKLKYLNKQKTISLETFFQSDINALLITSKQIVYIQKNNNRLLSKTIDINFNLDKLIFLSSIKPFMVRNEKSIKIILPKDVSDLTFELVNKYYNYELLEIETIKIKIMRK